MNKHTTKNLSIKEIFTSSLTIFNVDKCNIKKIFINRMRWYLKIKKINIINEKFLK